MGKTYFDLGASRLDDDLIDDEVQAIIDAQTRAVDAAMAAMVAKLTAALASPSSMFANMPLNMAEPTPVKRPAEPTEPDPVSDQLIEIANELPPA